MKYKVYDTLRQKETIIESDRKLRKGELYPINTTNRFDGSTLKIDALVLEEVKDGTND